MKIIITNTIACKMLGYSSDELLAKQFQELVIREKSQLALADMIFNENGEMIVFNGKVVSIGNHALLDWVVIFSLLNRLNCNAKMALK